MTNSGAEMAVGGGRNRGHWLLPRTKMKIGLPSRTIQGMNGSRGLVLAGAWMEGGGLVLGVLRPSWYPSHDFNGP
jgi:hypothetical protein